MDKHSQFSNGSVHYSCNGAYRQYERKAEGGIPAWLVMAGLVLVVIIVAVIML